MEISCLSPKLKTISVQRGLTRLGIASLLTLPESGTLWLSSSATVIGDFSQSKRGGFAIQRGHSFGFRFEKIVVGTIDENAITFRQLNYLSSAFFCFGFDTKVYQLDCRAEIGSTQWFEESNVSGH